MLLLSEIEHQTIDLSYSHHNGERVIRLNLEEFIEGNEDYYETTKHFVSYCPYCAEENLYTKKKLYIEKDNLSQGFCHRCHSIYFHWTTDLSYDVVQLKERISKFKLCKLPKSSPPNMGPDYSLNSFNSCSVNREGILEMLKYRNVDSLTNIGEDILVKRNIERYSPLIDRLDMRGGKLGDDQGFIMVPFKIGDELLYWQSKLYGYNIKYFMPPIAHKPFYIPEYHGRRIVIVEGIFDAMACLYLFPDRTPVAILGSYITDYHVWLLRNYIAPTDCLVFLDNPKLSLGVLFQLKGLVPTIINFSIHCSDTWGQDPDEMLLSMSNEELENFKEVYHYESRFDWEL